MSEGLKIVILNSAFLILNSLNNQNHKSMTYNSRQHLITWTSPSGKTFELKNINEFEYSFKHYGNLTTIMSKKEEENSLSFLKETKDNDLCKGDIFEDLGVSGRMIPLQIVFSGDNHDKESESFEKAFRELGESRIQLTFGKPIRVNAQTLSKKYNLVKDISSTIIDVEFIETKQNKPLSNNNNSSRLTKDNLKTELSNQQLTTAENLKNFINKTPAEKLQGLIDTFNKNLTKIANSVNNIQNNDFDAILRDIQANILNGVDITLLQEVSKLIDVGFSAISSAPYLSSLLNNIINNTTNNELNNETIINDKNSIINQETLFTNDYFISTTLLSGLKRLVDISSTIPTRKEATETAITIQELYTEYKKYYDSKYKLLNLNLNNLKANNTNINNILQITLGSLIEYSFNLKTEYKFILEQDTNLIELVYKYYKEEFKKDENKVNNNQTNNQTTAPEQTIMQEIIKINNIKDEEFISLEKGRDIILYL